MQIAIVVMPPRSHAVLSLRAVDHRTRAMAERIHAIQVAAYAQEAALLGVTRFPPLEQTLDELIGSSANVTGAFLDDALVGAIAVGRDDEGLGENIASLGVHPTYRRRGIGRSLLQIVIASGGPSGMTVQTAAGNRPALALYGRYGFHVYRRWFVGSECLELVKLRKEPQAAAGQDSPHAGPAAIDRWEVLSVVWSPHRAPASAGAIPRMS